MARVICIPVSDVFQTNAYIYASEATGHAFLVDPGAQALDVLQLIEREGFVIDRILLTHGHFDHTGAVAEISKALGIPYSIHCAGLRYLTDARLNLSACCRRSVVLENAEPFDDGHEFALADGGGKLVALHTPGHTPDSCIFYSADDRVAFVGDTIFKGSIGTDRYPGGNMDALQRSISESVFTLPPKTVLFSGHSAATDVQTECARVARTGNVSR